MTKQATRGGWGRRLVPAALAAAVFVCAGGAVAAQVVEPPAATFHVCVDNRSGAMRRVQAGEACRRNETPTSWTTGTIGYEVVRASGNENGAGKIAYDVWEQILCPSGKVPVGGGGHATLGFEYARVVASHPLSATNGWEVGFAKLDGSRFADAEELYYHLYVICVTASP